MAIIFVDKFKEDDNIIEMKDMKKGDTGIIIDDPEWEGSIVYRPFDDEDKNTDYIFDILGKNDSFRRDNTYKVRLVDIEMRVKK